MPQSFLIDITQSDIERGQRYNPTDSPEAIAIKRAVSQQMHIPYCFVMTGWGYCTIWIGSNKYAYDHEERLITWCKRYDEGKFVTPISFTMEKVSEGPAIKYNKGRKPKVSTASKSVLGY